MDATQTARPTELWNFLDEQGNPLQFNYHKIKHRGEHLPTVAKAIPAVWLNRKADDISYYALRQWIDNRAKGGMAIFLLASIRCLTALVRSPRYGDDHNGDNMGIAIEAAFDEIYSWPNRDPAYTDGIDFIAEATFCDPVKRPKYSDWRTYYYIRWIKRAAGRALDLDKKERRRIVLRSDFDQVFYHDKSQNSNRSQYLRTIDNASDPSEVAFEGEISNAIQHGLQGWTDGTGDCNWLGDWLDATIGDPIDKAIVKTKIAAAWRTHRQIIDFVNASFGTSHRHDKVSKCLLSVEKKLEKKLEAEFGWRPVKSKARTRASGIAPIEPVGGELFNEIPVGMLEAAEQYELDEDGYKIGPKILRHPSHRPPTPRPYSSAKSA